MTKSPIKVLLVEDSPVALEILQRVLKSAPEILLVGTARNGQEAFELIPKLEPNIICTDFHMARMDGLELTKQVMAKYPRPILVISNSVQADDCQNIFNLMQAGAVDIFPKPIAGTSLDYEQNKERLITKIKILAGVKVFAKPLPEKTSTVLEVVEPAALPAIQISPSIKIVTIGASTGGPQALQKVFSTLPSNFPVPIICTQHISTGFLQGLIDWLALKCRLKISIAKEGELPLPGSVYFAPDNAHLALDLLGRFMYQASGTIDGHCPSITVMFSSIAKHYGKATLGILLTGMGKDGAIGMKEISQAGGITIAQDEASSIIFGMPKEAIALGGVKYILPVQEISSSLLKIVALSH
jgi:two-component system, chemotaxis family, protein-glutamate methylesterase/glutaminase